MVTVQIQTETIKELSGTLQKISSAASAVESAVSQVSKELTKTLETIDHEVLTLSHKFDQVGVVLEDRSAALPGAWLWILLAVFIMLVLLLLVSCLLLRTRTELHRQPPSRVVKAVSKHWKVRSPLSRYRRRKGAAAVLDRDVERQLQNGHVYMIDTTTRHVVNDNDKHCQHTGDVTNPSVGTTV